MEGLGREDRQRFRARLARMRNPMHLLIFTRQGCAEGAAARQLGLDLGALSQNVHLELHDIDANPLLAARYGVAQTPAFALFTGGVAIEDTRIRFLGLPEGPVLAALVDGLVATSQAAALPAVAAVRRGPWLDRPLHLQVYVPCTAAADRQGLLRLERLALLSAPVSLDVMICAAIPLWARRAENTGGIELVVNGAIVLRDGENARQLLDDLEAATRGKPERQQPEAPARNTRNPGGPGPWLVREGEGHT
jgi:hypothetical protein